MPYKDKEKAKTYAKFHYEKYKAEYLKRSKLSNIKQRKKIRDFINSYKTNPCLDCKQTYLPCVMDFDHRPGEIKKFSIGESQINGRDLKKILDEMGKCDLVCANCHRIRTFERRTK